MQEGKINCIKMNSGVWKKSEHAKFMKGFARFGNNWKKIQQCVPTRTIQQIKSHKQKVFLEMSARDMELFVNEEKQYKYGISRHGRAKKSTILENSKQQEGPKVVKSPEPLSLLEVFRAVLKENQTKNLEDLEKMNEISGENNSPFPVKSENPTIVSVQECKGRLKSDQDSGECGKKYVQASWKLIQNIEEFPRIQVFS